MDSNVVSGFDPTTRIVKLASTDTNAIVKSIANDIDRFGAATLETIAGIGPANEFAKSRAWPLIRSYYAAFYAAHGICRIFGLSISNLSYAHSDAVRRAAVASGFTNGEVTVNDGMYLFEIDPKNNEITGSPLTHGSHEDTWRQFEKLLSGLQSRVLQGGGITRVSQDVFDCLQTVRDILNSNQSKANWLSKVRNNLNYRHDYGAWYPHGSGKHWSDVDSLFRAFLTDPMISHEATVSKIVVKFAKGCALVVALFCEILRDVAARHPSNKTFLLDRTIPVSSGSSRVRLRIQV